MTEARRRVARDRPRSAACAIGTRGVLRRTARSPTSAPGCSSRRWRCWCTASPGRATDLGITVALQFLPVLLLGAWVGAVGRPAQQARPRHHHPGRPGGPGDPARGARPRRGGGRRGRLGPLPRARRAQRVRQPGSPGTRHRAGRAGGHLQRHLVEHRGDDGGSRLRAGVGRRCWSRPSARRGASSSTERRSPWSSCRCSSCGSTSSTRRHGWPDRAAIRCVRHCGSSATARDLLVDFVVLVVVSMFAFNYQVSLPKLADERWGGAGLFRAHAAGRERSARCRVAAHRPPATRHDAVVPRLHGAPRCCRAAHGAWSPNVECCAGWIKIPLGIGGAGFVTGANAIDQQQSPPAIRAAGCRL